GRSSWPAGADPAWLLPRGSFGDQPPQRVRSAVHVDARRVLPGGVVDGHGVAESVAHLVHELPASLIPVAVDVDLLEPFEEHAVMRLPERRSGVPDRTPERVSQDDAVELALGDVSFRPGAEYGGNPVDAAPLAVRSEERRGGKRRE